MPRRRIRRKPLYPFLIHSGEVAFLKKDHSGTHDAVERAACGLEDSGHILQALPSLLLDRVPNNLPGYWIVRPRAGHEYKTVCPEQLGCMPAAETGR